MPTIQTEIFYKTEALHKRQRAPKTFLVCETIDVDVPDAPNQVDGTFELVDWRLGEKLPKCPIIDGIAWFPAYIPNERVHNPLHPGIMGPFSPGLSGIFMKSGFEAAKILWERVFFKQDDAVQYKSRHAKEKLIDVADYQATLAQEISSEREEVVALARRIGRDNCILMDGIVLSNRYEPMLAVGKASPPYPAYVEMFPVDSLDPGARRSDYSNYGVYSERRTIPEALAAGIDMGKHLRGDLGAIEARDLDIVSMDRSALMDYIWSKATIKLVVAIEDEKVVMDLLRDLRSLRNEEPLAPGIDERLVRYVEAISAVSPKTGSECRLLMERSSVRPTPEAANPSM